MLEKCMSSPPNDATALSPTFGNLIAKSSYGPAEAELVHSRRRSPRDDDDENTPSRPFTWPCLVVDYSKKKKKNNAMMTRSDPYYYTIYHCINCAESCLNYSMCFLLCTIDRRREPKGMLTADPVCVRIPDDRGSVNLASDGFRSRACRVNRDREGDEYSRDAAGVGYTYNPFANDPHCSTYSPRTIVSIILLSLYWLFAADFLPICCSFFFFYPLTLARRLDH